ncbi:hypothetical protein V9022_10460, partial [Streptococcus agalactiae]|uniref:hypothetical protein n=1 Tax=Streptococcus agalactiae TaxID=1311 RepID=UPI00300FF7CE
DNEAVLSSFGDNTAPLRRSQGKSDRRKEIRISPTHAIVSHSAATKRNGIFVRPPPCKNR